MAALAPRPHLGTRRESATRRLGLPCTVAATCLFAGPPALAAAGATDPVAQGLPSPVAQTRATLLKLAGQGAYEALGRFARDNGKGFIYHQGFEQRKPAPYWRQQAARGDDPLTKLGILLKLRPVQSNGVWVWPAAAVNPDESAWAALRPLYPAPRIQRFQAEGYHGWRTGIDNQGRWTMFLKGG